ncbi:MAG TPA: tyrosine-type recombinase/integrase [Stenomitos sp.]
MPFPKGTNSNHPKLGSAIKVEPIRTKKAIADIKHMLGRSPRDLCLFTLGINTAYRANELLSIRVGQVRGLEAGDVIDLKQSKTDRYRQVTLNPIAISAIQQLLASRSCTDGDYLFWSQQGQVLQVPTVTNMVKRWCLSAGLRGNYGSHSLRKTWGLWQYKRGTPIPLLMEAFGHQSQRQTMAYLGIQAKEMAQIFEMEL